MPSYIDQTGRTVILNSLPKKIISTVPSQTELICHLNLEEQLAGITRFCIHPEGIQKRKQNIGGTKNLDLALIRNINPDLIIANKEENKKDQIEELTNEFPVWVSDINNLEDAYEMIKSVGGMTGRKKEANKLTSEIIALFGKYSPEKAFQKIKAAYFIWKKPFMAVGGNTFINSIMEKAGIQNIFAACKRYPETNLETLLRNDCQLLMLSSEPYHFTQKHIEELIPLLPGVKIVLVDGEMFSWYGSRLLQTPQYLNSLLKEISDR